MKVLLINEVCGVTSTGKICTDIAMQLEKEGYECRIAYGRMFVPEQYQKFAYRIGNDWDVRLHGVKARLWDGCGFGSKRATENFIQWVRSYDPDVIHLHNLHGYYIHIGVLFDYLRICGKRVIWTLHDCWAYTGHCAYYSFADCLKWTDGCKGCIRKKNYPACIGKGNSAENYKKKRKYFTGIQNLTLVVPSLWLENEVKQSFLKDYPICVIPGGIDTESFRPTVSNLRQRYGLEEKKIYLGVANVWEERKGLSDFLKLAEKIDREREKIVLIGLTGEQIEKMPDTVLGIERTDTVGDLAAWYTTADVFLNLSTEETQGLTTVEAAACGTPVVTYDKTAVPEVTKKLGGVIVPVGCAETVLKEIRNICLSHNAQNMREAAMRYYRKEESNRAYVKLIKGKEQQV